MPLLALSRHRRLLTQSSAPLHAPSFERYKSLPKDAIRANLSQRRCSDSENMASVRYVGYRHIRASLSLQHGCAATTVYVVVPSGRSTDCERDSSNQNNTPLLFYAAPASNHNRSIMVDGHPTQSGDANARLHVKRTHSQDVTSRDEWAQTGKAKQSTSDSGDQCPMMVYDAERRGLLFEELSHMPAIPA